jgi:two-component system chemotaxis response regulator CheY
MARIVIVDDNLMIRRLLGDILSSGGHEVVGEAHDGLHAETSVRRLRPELVTLDLVMPRRGGLDALPALLAIAPQLVVVVCSASLDQRRVIAALRLGAKGFVVKPFDRESVLTNVADTLSRAARSKRPIDSATIPRRPPDGPPARRDHEQRDYTRVEDALAITVTPYGGDPVAAVTVDLSGTGALLSSGQLAPGTPVDFRLLIDAAEDPITGQARVVRVDARGRPALEFEHVSVGDHERLIAHVHRRRAALGGT